MDRKTVYEFKAVDGRTVTGFPSIFGNVDDGGDLIEPGAYAKTLMERAKRIRWLWQHEAMQPPTAVIVDAKEVGRDDLPAQVRERFPEAMGGLMVTREYLDTPRGNEVLAGIKADAITELSIGYDPILVEYPDPEKILNGKRVWRVLKEIRLWEASDVNWGMNAATANAKALLDLSAPAEEIAAQLKAAGRLDELTAVLRAPQRLSNDRRLRLEMLSRELALIG